MVINDALDFTPTPVTIRAIKGDTITPRFFVLNSNLSLFKMTGFTARARFKLNQNDTNLLWDLDLSNGLSIGKSIVTVGKRTVQAFFVRLNLPPNLTANVNWNEAFFDLKVTSPTGDISTISTGNLILS